MSIVRQDLDDDDVALSEETKIAVLAPSAAGALNKSEVEAQLDAAHKYGRSVRNFLNEALTLATFDKEVAMSCIYALPRGGKIISGPSVRLAEICASAYGNLHMGARVVGIEDKEIIAQGVCWDLEKNNRVTMEVRRRITKKDGRRFDDDMIVVTGNAAASIGLRNAIFRIIPKAYVNAVYQKAREVSVGTAFTLSETRAKVIERLTKLGVTQERILHSIERPSVDDITLDDVERLIGLGTAIKDGNTTIDEAFPLPEKIPAEKGKSAIDRIVEQKQQTASPSSAAPTTQPSQSGQGASTAQPSELGSSAPPAAEVKSADIPLGDIDPEAKCTERQFEILQSAQTEHDVEPKVFIAWVKSALGYKMVSHLQQKFYGRALKFLQSGGKE